MGKKPATFPRLRVLGDLAIAASRRHKVYVDVSLLPLASQPLRNGPDGDRIERIMYKSKQSFIFRTPVGDQDVGQRVGGRLSVGGGRGL